MAQVHHRLQQMEQELNACLAEAAALRARAAHYEELFVNASDAITVCDLDGVITEANQQAARLLGWSMAELIGQHVGQVTSATCTASADAVIQRFLATGSVPDPFEGELLDRTGQLIAIEASIRPLCVAPGQPSGFHIAFRDIGVQKQAERTLQQLSRRVLLAQEEERRHLAYELHDQIGQSLTVLKLTLEASQRAPEKLAPGLADSLQLVALMLAQVRALSLDLRPPLLDDLGLAAALRWHSQDLAQHTGWRLVLEVAELLQQPDALIAMTAFRVAQEALTNVARHAQAHQVSVILQQFERELCLHIADDGCGFAVAAAQAQATLGASLGLVGMAERVRLAGGRFSITSQPGLGTTIEACFPLAESGD